MRRKLFGCWLFLAAVACLGVFVAGCASQGTATITHITPVASATLRPTGLLVVYSATEQWPPWPGSTEAFRYPHTGYEIRTADGRLVKDVRNAMTHEDEQPACVTLPEGAYVAHVLSQTRGFVDIPLRIRAGRLTEVHLDESNAWKPLLAMARNPALVRTPSGRVIGYLENSR